MLKIKNANFFDKDFNLIKGIDLLINDGSIEEIGKIDKKCKSTFDASIYITFPSFINAHYHLGETIYRGFAPTRSLREYIKFTSKKSTLFDDENYDTICAVSIIEAIKNGTSIINCARGWDMVRKSGIKGALGYPLMKSKKLKNFYNNFDKNNLKLNLGKEEYNKRTLQIRNDIWIHSIEKIDEEILGMASYMFNKYDRMRLSIHVSETEQQLKNFMSKHSCTEIEFLDKYKLLNYRTNLVHCNYITNNDVSLIRDNNANITICPTSTIVLNNKMPDLGLFLKEKINVSVGTDGLAINNSASLLKEIGKVSSFYKTLNIHNKKLFKMITINPAKTLGFPDCGTIKVGNSADFCFFEISDLRLGSINNLLDYLLNNLSQPTHLMINGEFILQNNKICTLDEKTLSKKYLRLTERLK